MALESRLLRICCTRAWSWRMGGRSAGICVSRSMFFFSVSGRAMSHCAPITWLDAEVGQADVHLAASILARSRMSLIMSSSMRPDFWMFCT